mmetsp:Transcript_112758/g.155678  ORF Transcript_112758/g.155678 Transcript_112758/m.155678 type:complete len:126 (+) Transcript_112758:316-693(+)|eukprot:CAMPEP_0176365498 /NCGR_PEP_ID=MMETSP0126-20121128/20524_1 /TAXON_ID=141414 ORGANISM="Strombidinopsis acuminatum, Strain SPMC142" /NCGR_SAMPLE_ID=MMETSP0126 /ASSEMBLY_ACC=CAM_ASM_000229 /LENGTH=125 /DNA_ID=CAMNT_0017722547 /DNA_START=686 /DNA_END=1063 /DNA_ORIENTATION=+
MTELIEQSFDTKNDDDLKLYKAVYYFNTSGFLTAVDSLKEISGQVFNSELARDELFAKIISDDSGLDKYAKEQLEDAIKNLEGNIDIEFYGLADFFKPEEEEVPAEEEQTADAGESVPEVDATEE